MFDLKELFKMGGTISKKSEIVVGGIGLIFLLIVWYLVTKNGLIPTKILPNPVDVVKSYGVLITELDLFKNVWYSISLNLLGYFYALLIAIPLGFVIGLYPVTNALFSKYFLFSLSSEDSVIVIEEDEEADLEEEESFEDLEE